MSSEVADCSQLNNPRVTLKDKLRCQKKKKKKVLCEPRVWFVHGPWMDCTDMTRPTLLRLAYADDFLP